MSSAVNWQEISSLPTGDEMILAWCPPCKDFVDGRMMIWRGIILARNLKGPTPAQLSFPATHWAHLPAPPAQPQ